MKYIYLLLFIGITSHCYAWSPTYKTNDRTTNYNFEDLSTAVVDNYSKQYIRGKKTFSDSVTFSSMTVTDATINNAGISDLSVTAMSATQINVSSVTASGEITTGYGFYHDRQPTVRDFTIEKFTMNSSWYDLDLSTIVPAGVKAVHLSIIGYDDKVGSTINFRRNGSSNSIASEALFTQAVNVSIAMNFICAVDENRIIEYMANEQWSRFDLTVLGWWK